MFKKLRNRFLILNLVIISVMLIISFASIYLITYKNVRSGIDMELRKIEDSYFMHNDNGMRPPDFGGPKPGHDNFDPPRDHSASFTVETDPQWNIINKSSSFSIDSSLYEVQKGSRLTEQADRRLHS